MNLHYLEIVTEGRDAVCAAYAAAYDVEFGEPDARLGDARLAPVPEGGWVGVRTPMRQDEGPVVRPYWLVDDIEGALQRAEVAGGEVALQPLELPGFGRCAIYILGGVQHGIWQK